MSILNYIEKMKEMYEGERITAQEPRNMAQGGRIGFADKGFVSGYTKKARTANQIKYEKILTEMLSEIDVMKEKGYGNVSSLVEKYSDQLGLTKEKVKKYYDADGIFKKHAWNVEQTNIRGAVIDAAKQADITDLPDNMIKAVEDYKKFKGKITRGETAKIIRANNVPESSLYKALNKVDAFVKQKKKWKNIDAKNKFIADERAAALKKYSSDNFEKITRGSNTVQGGHTGDIYNDFVTPKTKKYTPTFINQETLKEYDALIKATGEARDKAIKAKDWKKVERLNTKGINISAASEGYKTFKVVQPDGSSYIYGIDDITTSDPMSLTKEGITAQELTKGKDVEFEKAKKLYKAKKISKAELEVARAAAEKKLFEAGTHRDFIKVQKEEAMKAAKLSKKEIIDLDKRLGKNFKEIVTNSKRGGALLTHNTLNKSEKLKKVKICKTDFANGGGALCGKAFADADPQAYLEKVMKDQRLVRYLQSKEGLTAARSFLNTAAKVGSWANPLTIVGGEAWYSTLAGINEYSKGASLGEAVNEGLWFIPGKHSRSLDELLGPKTKGKVGRNLPVIPDKDRAAFDLLTQLGGLVNEEGKLSGQLFMQQLETGRLEDVKAKSLWEERFDPEKAFAPEKSAADIKLDYENMRGDIQWSKDVITPQIEERLKNVMTKGEDLVQQWQTADPTGQSYSALQNKIKDFIVEKYNRGKGWERADPYSGSVWNWIKRKWQGPQHLLGFQLRDKPGLWEKQKELDYKKLTGQLEDQPITKENIPPELIENFLTEFPEYSYIFEGASGGRAGYMGGGITGIRRPNAVAPDSGPMSQGLRSLYINDRDY